MAYEDLTGKQRLFVDAYISTANCNATEAARQAGYACPDPQGRENLRKPTVKAAIQERMEALAMPAVEVLSRLSEQAAGRYGDFIEIDEDGQASINLKALKAAGLMRLVKKISFDAKGNQVVEFHDTQAALSLLARSHGLLKDRTEHGGSVDFNIHEAREDLHARLAGLAARNGANGVHREPARIDG